MVSYFPYTLDQETPMTLDALTKMPIQLPHQPPVIHLNHCGISPLCQEAQQQIHRLTDCHANAALSAADYLNAITTFHQAAAQLLDTQPHNIAYLQNTAEGMGLIANGYPFQAGDRIVSYVHEYPSNHYAWKIQERRGAKLELLTNTQAPPTAPQQPGAWSLDELAQLVAQPEGHRIKLVSVSHVQFTSGFAADLKQLGQWCYDHGIDLVVDAAQSLGSLALYPEAWHISAVAASGWKWLLGPIGSGVLYTSPSFRAKLDIVLAGPEVMQQGDDYLDHRWQPHTDSRRFEFSTLPPLQVAGLAASLQKLNQYGIAAIQREIFRLQDYFLSRLDQDRYPPYFLAPSHRSGIIALMPRQSPQSIVAQLQQQHIICSTRGGYLRIAPHFYNDEAQLDQVLHHLNDGQ